MRPLLAFSLTLAAGLVCAAVLVWCVAVAGGALVNVGPSMGAA